MGVLRVLLFPFAVIFRVVTGIRNHLYSIGHKKSFEFDVPVINVGNLNIGGSGKTPAVEYLIRLLKNNYHVATLSRGYGRRSRGLRFASQSESASSLGDEPFQFFRNFGKEIKVVVAEDRAFAIPTILNEFPDTNVVLLDDAYQHRSVLPHLTILLTDYAKPFFQDYLLPMGRLRERRGEASRADVIVVTKCRTDLDDLRERDIKNQIAEYAIDKPVFFSNIKYGKPQSFAGTDKLISKKIVLVTGIAREQPLLEYVTANFELIKHFPFRDHHQYTINEVQSIAKFVSTQKDTSLLTTEKDMVRLIDPEFDVYLSPILCFYLPIEMNFIKNGAEFDMLVLRTIQKVMDNSQSVNE